MESFLSAGTGIDVDGIMESIRRRIAEKKESGLLKDHDVEEIEAMELLPLPDFLEIPNVYRPSLYPEGPSAEVPPYVPIPFQPPVITVDESGSGIRGLLKALMRGTRQALLPLIRFMTRPLYLELKQLGIDNQGAIHRSREESRGDHHRLTARLDHFGHITTQSREYIKLLHNALNNMIVEASKLKIEEELLKTRLRVLEDKIEFLENRQRAVEEKALTQ
ncbi:MAG TPA: hypothetical protein PKK12_06665 [Candidatus Aminicenantes bacterium]|nr:hypothetical protein [Candidatus Aminicenantes bacterium]